MLFISKQIFIKHFLTTQIFHDRPIFEIDMGNCGSNENQISFWYCESCGADVDNHGFVELKHNDVCTMGQTIRDLKSTLNEHIKINSSLVQKRQAVLACSETAERRIIDLEAEITRLNGEINSSDAKIPELMRRLNESEKRNSSLAQKSRSVMLWSDTAQRRIKELEAKITGLNGEINSLNLKLDDSRKQNLSKSKDYVQSGQTIMPWSENTQTTRTPSFREVVLEEETARLKNEIISLNLKLDESRKQNSSNVQPGKTNHSDVTQKRKPCQDTLARQKNEINSLNSKTNEKSNSKINKKPNSKSTERSRSWAIKKGIQKIN